MRIERLGSGEPSVAVVAAIHGDEPCGVRAVERVLDDPPVVEEAATLIVANERALDRGVRYVDEDLNRAFPGDREGTTHEARLAAELTEELQGCTTLALHSTQSHPEPFAVVEERTELAERLCPRLPVDAIVETGSNVEGRLFASIPTTIEVECGRQGTDSAADNAERLIRAFLDATGVTDERPAAERKLPVFRLRDRIPKPAASEYDVLAENFRRVEDGEPFASADGEPLAAEEPFYPILLSANGYEELFGYTADRIGPI